MSIPARSRSAVCLVHILALACFAVLLCARPARAEKVTITPESPEGQNIANAADLLEKLGEVDVANRIRDRLSNGKYSYDTELSENAETGTGSQYTNIAERVIRFSRIPTLRDKPWDPEKHFDMIFGLARTLYHEDVHSGQGYFSSLWGSLPGETTYETDAWTKTIAAEGAWIHNAFSQHTLTPKQLSIMARDLSSYIGSFKDQEQPWYGLSPDLQPIYLGIAENAQFLAERFEQMAAQPPAGAVSSGAQPPANPPAAPASTSPCDHYADCPPALDWCERGQWFRDLAAKERQWAQDERRAGREHAAEGFEHMAKMDDGMADIRFRQAEREYQECLRKRGVTTATGAAPGTGASTTPVTFPTGPQDCRFYRQMAADARRDAEFWKRQVAIDEARIRDATSPEVKQSAENDLQKDQTRVRDREQKAEEWERKVAACPEEYRTAVDSPPPTTATGTGPGAAPGPSGQAGTNAAGGALTPAGAPQQPCPTQADCDKLCAAAGQAEREAAAAKAALEQAEADRQRDIEKAQQAEKDAEMQKYNRDNRISVNLEIAAQRRAYAKKLREDADAAVAKAKAEAEAKAKAAAELRAACDACRPCPEQTKTAAKTGADATPTQPGQTAVGQPPSGANAASGAPVPVGSATVGDVSGSGTPQVIIGAVPGSPPQVQVLNGTTGQQLSNFLAYPPSFIGGVHVAVGDLNGDGKLDIVTGPGSGGAPQVKVFNATGQEFNSFFAYNPSFTGGVKVAVGDLNGDGNAEIITGPGPGGAPQVKVFNGGGQELNSFFPFNQSFPGGVNVAAGDLNGDRNAEIVTGPGPGGASQVKVFNGSGQELNSFFAFEQSLPGGLNVAVGDVNGDGKSDIITSAGPGSTPQLKAFNGMSGEEYKSEFLGGIEFEVARSVSLGVRYVHSRPPADGVNTIGTAAGLTPEEAKKACEAALGDKPCENLGAANRQRLQNVPGAIYNTESGFLGGRYMGNPGVDLKEDFFTVETSEGATGTGSVLDNALEIRDFGLSHLAPSTGEKPSTGERPSDSTLFSPSFTGLRFGFTFDGGDAGTTPTTDPEKQSILSDAGEVDIVVTFALPRLSPNQQSRSRHAAAPLPSQPALQPVAYRTGAALPLRFQAASANQSAPPSKQAPPTRPTPMQFSIVSNGKTGDEALQLQVFDPSGKVKQIRLRPGVVLEPLKQTGAAPKPFAERHAGAAAGKLLTRQISAVCLDFVKLPPQLGTLYRIAPLAVQEKLKPLSAILRAGHKLADSGKLHPDSEPKAYAAFIRQFALWTKLENWDAQKFTDAFLDRSKKNAEVMNLMWTKEVEDELRAAAPGRWQDITAVLSEAEAISRASVTKPSD